MTAASSPRHVVLAVCVGVAAYAVAVVAAYGLLWAYFLIGISADIEGGFFVVVGSAAVIGLAGVALWRTIDVLSYRIRVSRAVSTATAFLLAGVSLPLALVYLTMLNSCVFDVQFPVPGSYGCDT